MIAGTIKGVISQRLVPGAKAAASRSARSCA